MEAKLIDGITSLLMNLPQMESTQDVCRFSIDIIKGVNEFDSATISLFTKEGVLQLKSGFGFTNDTKQIVEDIDYSSLLDFFDSENKSKFTLWNKMKKLSQYIPELAKLGIVIVFPIISKIKLVGVIAVGNKKEQNISQEKQSFLDIIGAIINNQVIHSLYTGELTTRVTHFKEVMKSSRHNFANNLQSIALGLELLSSTNLTEEQQKFVKILTNAKNSAIKEIDDLRNMKNDLEREVEINIGLEFTKQSNDEQ